MTNIITIDELKNSVLNANIDDEYIQPAITEAQTIYLREILGDALLNAIVNKINGNTLTGKYLTLVNEYIKPYLSYMVQSIIVVPITYKIRNAGVIQQYDQGFTSTQMKDTQYLKDYYDGKAEFYGNRLTTFLQKNSADFPEYRLSASNVTNPTTTQNVTNIFLGGTKRGKCGGVSSSGGGGSHDTVDWDDITNRPNFATVATSGSYNDLSDKPEIPSLEGYATEQWVENQGYSTFSGDYNDLTNKPELFSGDYNDLTNKPTIPTVNNATLTIKQGGVSKGTFTANAGTDVEINLDAGGGGGSTDWSDITNKPNFATVATSGSYSDLSNTPNLATVATSGSYNDLSDKPTIPSAQVNSDWNASSGVQQILNKPTLATVATSGSYSDLSNTPNLATVATTGSYNDLSNTPSLATVATSGDYTDLSNKPDLSHYVEDTDLASVATSGSYNDLSDKPTIPVVPAYAIETLSFTLSDSSVKAIDFFIVPDYFYVENLNNHGTGTLTITKQNASSPTIEVFKSDDKINWTSMGTTDTTGITASVLPLSKLYLKASPINKSWGTQYGNGNIISMSTNHNIGGNIASLLYGDNFNSFRNDSWGNTYMFYRLFYNDTNLISAGNLTIPAIATAHKQCFSQMFSGCTNLTTAPKIIHVSGSNLGTNSFNTMFYGCTSLTKAPHLIVDSGYYGNNIGFDSMYANCTSLNKVVITVNYLGTNNWNNWLTTCAATGDFYSLGTATPTAPEGWTVHTSL